MKVNDIGKEIKRLRKENAMTQVALSVKSMYSPEHISVIERTSTHMSVESLCNILDALGYELEFAKKSDV